MGCVNSRADLNELRPNLFQVINVDDSGNLITPGRLEVTDAEIILYQRDKQPIQWPLRCLRRYGYDAEIFSFEAGRRCSTGPGIYAFKCRRAAHLFNLVQTNIQVCNNSGEDTISRELPVAPHIGPATTRVTIPVEPNYLDPTPTRINGHVATRFAHTQQNGIGRFGSVGSSGGLVSPQGTTGSPSPPPMLPPAAPPPLPPTHPSSLYVNEEVLLSSLPLEIEHNNNKSLSRPNQRACTTSTTTGTTVSDSTCVPIMVSSSRSVSPGNSTDRNVCGKTSTLPTATYMNVDIISELNQLSANQTSGLETDPSKEIRTENSEVDHSYMNINPANMCQDQVERSTVKTHVRPPALVSLPSDIEDTTRHCYANLEPGEIEGLRKRISGVSIPEKSPLAPSTPISGPPVREVNYAVLDLDQKDTASIGSPLEGPSTSSMGSPPESPNRIQKGYATIDFNKTAALSHSVNPNLVNDNEGSRKTRHNSTISELSASCRHSSSLSE